MERSNFWADGEVRGSLTFCVAASHYIVLTSNIGSLAIARTRQSGAALERVIQAMAQQYLRPELVARLDCVIVFQRLTDEALGKIQRKFLEQEFTRLEKMGYSVETEEVHFSSEIFNGARSIRRSILNKIYFDVLAEILEENQPD